MNRSELEITRKRNFSLLDRGYRPKINAIELEINNSYEHEKGKFDEMWRLLQEGKLKKKWEVPKIVSEARFSNTLRADLFDLDNGEVIEIVNSEKEDSIKKKKRAYVNMGLKFRTVEVK